MEKLRLAIIGVGLIGGSFGLAIKDKLGEKVHIIGLFRSPSSLNTALGCGAVDEGSLDPAILTTADIVYLSTPVLQIVPMVKKILPFLRPGTILTDAGSTKGYLWNALTKLLPNSIYYVSGHPMTGKEKSGVQEASKDLFRNKCYVLMRETTAPPEAYQKIVDLISVTGANLTTLGIDQHDRCASVISHVPHVAAAALVMLLERSEGDLSSCLKLAGGGFKDTTRIASSNADMWADICVTNPREIAEHLRSFQAIVSEVIAAIEAGDRQAVHDYFMASKKRRDCILDETERWFEI